VTDNVMSTMHTKSSKGKEIRIPGPDHPITISPAEGKVRVTVAGRTIAPRSARKEPASSNLPCHGGESRPSGGLVKPTPPRFDLN